MAMETKVIDDVQSAPNLEYGYGMNSTVMIVGVHDHSVKSGFFMGSYHGDSFSSVIESLLPSKAIKFLVRAVNNRTIERNYFRLYSQLLEGTISEATFDKEIEKNEKDYVIETNFTPELEDVKVALQLASKIKDMNSSSDLSMLFSFDPDETDRLLSLPEISNGNLQ